MAHDVLPTLDRGHAHATVFSSGNGSRHHDLAAHEAPEITATPELTVEFFSVPLSAILKFPRFDWVAITNYVIAHSPLIVMAFTGLFDDSCRACESGAKRGLLHLPCCG